MENASKALLIAGAILIVILLISLGIYIYSQAQQQVDSVNMDEQEILAFNNKFAPYFGENVTGAQVNALLQQVIASNGQATELGYQSIALDSSGNITDLNSRASTGEIYKVTPTYGTDGRLTTIKIEE